MGNPMATEIINLLKKDKSLTDIKAILLEKYEVELPQLERDLDDLNHQLREANLLD